MQPVYIKPVHQCHFLTSHTRGLFTILLFIIQFTSLPAQEWTPKQNGMYGGIIKSMTTIGNTMLIGTQDCGIFISKDNGNTWSWSGKGLADRATVTSLVTHGTEVYASTFFSGVYVSKDNGDTWTQLSIAGINSQVTSLVIINDNLMIGTVNGIYISKNKGQTWTAANVGLPQGFSGPNPWVLTLFKDGTSVYAGLSYRNLYVTKDEGATWQPAYTGIPDQSYITNIARNSAGLYASTNSKLYFSSNNGTNWIELATEFPLGGLITITVDGDNLYAGTSNGLYVSVDNGSTWTLKTASFKEDEKHVYLVRIINNEIFIVNSTIGLRRSSDNGSTWIYSNNGFTAIDTKSLVRKGNSIFASTINGVFQSTDKGATWHPSNHSQFRLDNVFVKGDSLLAQSSKGIYLSTDLGATWSPLPSSGLPPPSIIANPLFHKNGDIYVDTFGKGLFVLKKNATAYQPANAGMESNTLIFSVYEIDHVMYALGSNFVYKSTDNGQTWSVVPGLPQGDWAQSMAKLGNKLFLQKLNQGLFVSENGSTWSAVPIGNSYAVTKVYASDGYGFIGTYFGPYFSVDKGAFWTEQNKGFNSLLKINSFIVVDDELFAGTTQGVWSIPLSAFAPSLTSFSPSNGVAGTSVTITGTNFSPSPAFNEVKFNGVKSNIVNSTRTTITAQVPAGATKGKISVTVNEQTAQSSTDFCVNPPKPTITATDMLTENATLTSSSAFGNQWFFNDSEIPGATQQTYKPSVVGSYSVQVTIESCKSQMSETVAYIFTGTHEPFTNTLIYPTVVKDVLHIDLTSLPLDQEAVIDLINVMGQPVLRQTCRGGLICQNDMQTFAPGIYIVRINQSAGKGFARIVKQ